MYWDCIGTFDIAGKIDSERTRNRVFAMDIRGWKNGYRRLNEDNYDMESRARWSSVWGRDAKPDLPAASDTTDNEESSHEDDEESDHEDYDESEDEDEEESDHEDDEESDHEDDEESEG
jgi:hypothetical protein